jgi:hemolysin III
VLHQYAFVAFGALGVALVFDASGAVARAGAAVFASSLVLAFGISALYHRVTWTPAGRERMRSLDHAGIFLLIAGTYTPFGLLVLGGAWRYTVLAIVWGGALIAVGQRLVWRHAPKWVTAALGIVLGWVGIAALPKIVAQIGWAGTALVVTGGLLYTIGALVYALRRPDPLPRLFGYHELFHAFTIAAAASQFAAVAFFVF